MRHNNGQPSPYEHVTLFLPLRTIWDQPPGLEDGILQLDLGDLQHFDDGHSAMLHHQLMHTLLAVPVAPWRSHGRKRGQE